MTSLEDGMALPASWRRHRDPDPGVVAAAHAPAAARGGVRPEIVLRAVRVATDQPAWQAQELRELGRLAWFELDDEDDYEDAAGHRVVYRRFAHERDGADLLSDQWSWLAEQTGVTLTCTAARADYPDWCDLFEDVADGIDLVAVLADRTTPC